MARNLFRKEEVKAPSIDIPSGFVLLEDIGRNSYRCTFCNPAYSTSQVEYDIRARLYVKHRRDLMRLTETEGRGFMDYALSRCKRFQNFEVV